MSILQQIKNHQTASDDALSFVRLYNTLGWFEHSRASLHEADAHRRAAKQLIASYDAVLKEMNSR
jgi:hypothetical protein